MHKFPETYRLAVDWTQIAVLVEHGLVQNERSSFSVEILEVAIGLQSCSIGTGALHWEHVTKALPDERSVFQSEQTAHVVVCNENLNRFA